MTDDEPEADGPASATHDQGRPPVDESGAGTPKTEAERYAKSAAERPDAIRGAERRLVELLRTTDPSEPIESELERRVAAGTALARVASEDSSAIRGHADELVDELRREHARKIPADVARAEALSGEVTETLVRTVALVVADQPEVIAEIDDLSHYVAAITTDLETGTLRTATKAFFASASELQRPAAVVETLGELLTYPDSVVQAWSAGALGRLAEEHPDEIATTADDLRRLVEHDDDAVQHNAVEALGALVRERPDAVVPAADALRAVLTHRDVAIRHNAAGVFGHLAETRPDAVIPAIEDLRNLCTHEDEAVRRIATGALARLAQERPEVVVDG